MDLQGTVPISEHKRRMKELYDQLVYQSGIAGELGADDEMMTLFDALLLHVTCDMAMLTKKPGAVRMQMIEDGIRLIGINPVIAPKDYVISLATGTGPGADLARYFMDDGNKCGAFWSLMNVASGRIENKGALTGFLDELTSILIQLEKYFADKYPPLGADMIALNYIFHITDMMVKDYA